MAPNANASRPSSPFLAPSTPRQLVRVSTPRGSSRLVKKESPAVSERQSTVAGKRRGGRRVEEGPPVDNRTCANV